MGCSRKTEKGQEGSETTRMQRAVGCLFLESNPPKWLLGEHLVEQSNETWLKSDQEMGSRFRQNPKFSETQSPALFWSSPQPWGKVFADVEEYRLCPRCSVPGWALEYTLR